MVNGALIERDSQWKPALGSMDSRTKQRANTGVSVELQKHRLHPKAHRGRSQGADHSQCLRKDVKVVVLTPCVREDPSEAPLSCELTGMGWPLLVRLGFRVSKSRVRHGAIIVRITLDLDEAHGDFGRTSSESLLALMLGGGDVAPSGRKGNRIRLRAVRITECSR